MQRDLPVTTAHGVEDAFEAGRLAHAGGVEGASVHPSHHQRPRLGVDDFRRDPGSVRRPRRGQLVHAIYPVLRNVLADTHDVALAGILDDEVDVGDPAAERLRCDLALPAGEARGAFQVGRHEGNAPWIDRGPAPASCATPEARRVPGFNISGSSDARFLPLAPDPGAKERHLSGPAMTAPRGQFQRSARAVCAGLQHQRVIRCPISCLLRRIQARRRGTRAVRP